MKLPSFFSNFRQHLSESRSIVSEIFRSMREERRIAREIDELGIGGYIKKHHDSPVEPDNTFHNTP